MSIRSTSAPQPCKQVTPEDLAWGPQALQSRNSLNRQRQAAIAESTARLASAKHLLLSGAYASAQACH